MRQIILDTETTGLSPQKGHRIIEIGAVEMLHRRLTGKTYHVYINPEREVDRGAFEVHGLSSEFLSDKPLFKDIYMDFIAFIEGAELIIHNAPFDAGFIDHEFKLLKKRLKPLNQYSVIVDTLKMARKMHPGQRNSLDALCKRYSIDNTNRTLHGALLDSEILARVYLAMTGGQESFNLEEENKNQDSQSIQAPIQKSKLKIINATPEELSAHEKFMEKL